MKLLVIEDNPLNMELVCDLLEIKGFDVEQATSAEDGIKKAREGGFDAILMDIQLPGMDGLEATGILKSDHATNSIKIIALTSHAMNGYEDKVRAAGCDGYITKPIDTRGFVDQLKSFL